MNTTLVLTLTQRPTFYKSEWIQQVGDDITRIYGLDEVMVGALVELEGGTMTLLWLWSKKVLVLY